MKRNTNTHSDLSRTSQEIGVIERGKNITLGIENLRDFSKSEASPILTREPGIATGHDTDDLLKIQELLFSQRELTHLLDLILRILCRLLRAERATIFLEDSSTGGLWSRSYLPPNMETIRLKEGIGLAGHVFETGESLIINDPYSDSRFCPDVDRQTGFRTQNLLVKALSLRTGERVGVLEVLNRLEGDFTREDLSLLDRFSSGMALAITNAVTWERREAERQALLDELDRGSWFEGMVGRSNAMRNVFHLIHKTAPSDLTVLITGETGTGKELVARAIHARSGRKAGPFVAVNCTALTEQLLDSELFGHVKGAFTGAQCDRKGLFETADGGTLFLDEIGDTTHALQAKLLRVLEQGEIVPVGSSRKKHVNVRVLAATNQDLREAVREKRFREDLYHRLNVVHITLPPLRERPKDVELLIEHFLREFSPSLGEPVLLTEGARRALLRCSWPGNVRQLRHVLEVACQVAESDVIELDDLPPLLDSWADNSEDGSASLSLRDAREAFERDYFDGLLRAHQGVVSEVARAAGIDRRNVYVKIEQLGLDHRQYRK